MPKPAIKTEGSRNKSANELLPDFPDLFRDLELTKAESGLENSGAMTTSIKSCKIKRFLWVMVESHGTTHTHKMRTQIFHPKPG